MAPIASHYRSAFATVIMNNLISAKSLNMNCEKDSAKALLTEIHELILDTNCKSSDSQDNTLNFDDTIIFEPESTDNGPQFTETELISCLSSQAISLLCGTICRTFLQTTQCKTCKNYMQEIANRKDSINKRKMEISENMPLVYPSAQFIENFKTVYDYVNIIIPHVCQERDLKKIILSHLNEIPTSVVGCLDHNKDIILKMKELTVVYCLISFCKEVNKLLHGKIKVLPPNHNFMHENALLFREKRKKIGKHSDIFE